MISNELKKFLKENKNLINNAKTPDGWLHIYGKFEDEYPEEVAGELSKVLLSIGVDPCKIIGEVPRRFLRDQKINNYKIPNNVTYIGAQAFDGTDLSIFEIPKGVTGIDYSAFSETNLKEVVLPNSVKILENAVFSYNYNLEKIDFGSVVHMGDYQCIDCINLREVILPNAISYIDTNCFEKCPKLKNIIFKGTIAEWELIVGDYIEDWIIPIHCSDGIIK